MARRNLEQEIARILDTRASTPTQPSAYQIIAENLQKMVTHYLVLNPTEIYRVIDETIGDIDLRGGTSGKSRNTAGFGSTVQTVVDRFCTGLSRPSFQSVMNTRRWGGLMSIATVPPPEVTAAAGRGNIFVIPATENFNLTRFGLALTNAKSQCLIDPLKRALRSQLGSGHSMFQTIGSRGIDWFDATKGGVSRDLAKLHGVGSTHTTSRVGTAVAGPKSTGVGNLEGADDVEFGLPLFRKTLFDDLKLAGHIISDGSTSQQGVHEEVEILLEMASARGKQHEQDEWDAAGPELIAALNRAATIVLASMESRFGRGSEEWEASASPQKRLKRMAAEVVTKQITKGIKPPTKVKKKITEPKVRKGRKTTSARKTVKAPRKKAKKQIVKVKKGGKSASGIQRQRATPWRNKAGLNPVGLKALIQKSLPDVIARKMTGAPTLQYRTGRFAQSAEITDIVPMPRSVEIRYDYMQDPYRVFEPGSGSPLATRGRDPRELIGSSIREIAQMIMGTKFGIVRTKRV